MACSSEVEQLTVNQPVAGSIPAMPALGDWRSGSAVDLHSIGRGFESLITHPYL